MKNCSRKLKPGKTDPLLCITSDCLVDGPQILFDLLSYCLQSYVVHGHVSEFLLMSTMVPIVKDKLDDITSSDNYRSIAIISLVMKLYDLTYSLYLAIISHVMTFSLVTNQKFPLPCVPG